MKARDDDGRAESEAREKAGARRLQSAGGAHPTPPLPFESSVSPAMAEAATSASAGGLGEAAAESISTGGLQPRGALLAVREAKDEDEAEFDWEQAGGGGGICAEVAAAVSCARASVDMIRLCLALVVGVFSNLLTCADLEKKSSTRYAGNWQDVLAERKGSWSLI